MAYDFNADEVFEVAIRIEKNSGRFYRKAAELQSDQQNQAILEKLASMEDHHRLTLENMKTHISEMEKTAMVLVPMGESVQYLAAMADSHGGEGSQRVSDS
jgi:rubrerythrin